jgi:1-acyl-sn-glycerol-3-phosphate acyltransferase
LVIVGFSYVITGILLIPFGAAGKFYRSISAKFGSNMLFWAGGRGDIVGLDNLDPAKTYVFVGNHQSYVDIFLLQWALGKVNMRTLFVIKKELFKIPLFGYVIRNMGLIPIDRSESRQALIAMKNSVAALKEGFSITIFPEGTRTCDGNLQPFKRGAFLLAEQTGFEIAPFVVAGTFYIFPRNNFRIKGGKCKITFLKPIEAGKYKSKELTGVVEKIISEQYANDKAELDLIWKKE